MFTWWIDEIDTIQHLKALSLRSSMESKKSTSVKEEKAGGIQRRMRVSYRSGTLKHVTNDGKMDRVQYDTGEIRRMTVRKYNS